MNSNTDILQSAATMNYRAPSEHIPSPPLEQRVREERPLYRPFCSDSSAANRSATGGSRFRLFTFHVSRFTDRDLSRLVTGHVMDSHNRLELSSAADHCARQLMADGLNLVRIPTLKTVSDFRQHVASLRIDLPCEDSIVGGSASPLLQPIQHVTINRKKIGARYAVQPMEGWDGTTIGGVTEEVIRRWRRFGESGAKLILGGEAMAVRPDGRANPNQLIINEANKTELAKLRDELVVAHASRFGK